MIEEEKKESSAAEEIKRENEPQENQDEKVKENLNPKEIEDSIKKEDEDKEEKADNEKYMRLMAEFQNYKKRVAKEKSDIHAYANEKIVTELLEVLDNFERALEDSSAEVDESYSKGMEMIFSQLKEVLKKAGLDEIEALGKDFDPTYHNAVMTNESEEYDSGKIMKVLQKGYILNGRVIRPAMVAVSK